MVHPETFRNDICRDLHKPHVQFLLCRQPISTLIKANEAGQEVCSSIDGFNGFDIMDDLMLHIRTQYRNLGIEIGGNKMELVHRGMLLNHCSIVPVS